MGHTGSLSATIEAVEHVDACVGDLIDATRKVGGTLIITADHGNADQMYGLNKKTGTYTEDAEGNRTPHTSHSLNPVPIWLFDTSGSQSLSVPSGPVVNGGIAQIGATLLHILGLARPDEYLPSLIQE